MMTMSPGESAGTRQRSTPAFARAGAGAEDLAIHRPVDDKGRGHRIDAQTRHKRGCFPVSVRLPPDQAGTASAAPAQASHVGSRAGLVDKDQLCRIKLRLEGFPRLPRHRHGGALPLGGVHVFLKRMPCRSKNRHTELTPTRRPRSPRSRRISRVRSARSPISANSQSGCGCSGERLRPFCDLAAALPMRRQRPIQAVAVNSPMPNRRPAPRAEKPPSTARMTRMRRSLEYALAMPSPNTISLNPSRPTRC